MKLGTKLTVYISFLIILVLAGYGSFDILSRRDILVRKIRAEARSTGRTLEVSLERASLPQETEYIQGMIDAVSEQGRTLGVIVYYQAGDTVIRSRSLTGGVARILDSIKAAITENRPQEEFGVYEKNPVFFYVFPLKDRFGKSIGGVSILQQASFMEREIENAKWNILATIFVLIGGMVALVLWGARKWVTEPISKLMEGTKELAKGNLGHQIDLKRKGELSELAGAFNQMAADLQKARQRVFEEAETRLELERTLRQSEKLATVGQLASGLAHEIGTPLNIISGRAELTKKKPDDRGGVEKNQDMILCQAGKITRIIHQLLGFVRKKRPEHKAQNIHELLETTLDFLNHQIENKGVKVTVDIPADVPAVAGDGDQLQQVFLNLILNAIQAMPDGGILRLSASVRAVSRVGLQDSKKKYVVVRVEDTGIGMEREVLQNIFNPFFTTKVTGTGLGLMVSHGIVQDHEGWVEVESEVGKGSTFKVYLPAPQGVEE